MTDNQNQPELLPLPEPVQWFIDVTTNGRSTGRYEVCAEEYRDSGDVVPLFTADQMREYALANLNRCSNNEGQDGLTDSAILTDAHRYCCKYVHADDAPYRFTERGIIEFVKLRIARHLSSHPAPDNQQAKDAALLRDLLEEARDDVCECLNQMMVLAGYPSGDKKIARQREFLARIDAALSTTKQEEV